MTSPSTRSAPYSPSAEPIPSPLRSEESVSLGWLDALVRHRKIAYAFMVLMYVASFNGIWRVGVDSALYRGLARSLARDGTYTFAGEPHTHAFAGFPLMLAALSKVFGESPLPGLIMVCLMALATLWLIDATLRLRYPLWVATVVTLGVGLNFRYIRQSQELMTDIPFMLGVMMSLYGYERLKETLGQASLLRVASLFIAGLALAASTRPTFGVLVIALVLASAYAAFSNRDGRRHIHLAIVGGAVLIAGLLVLADPRTVSSAPFSGRYELELRDAVRDLPTTAWEKLHLFLGENFNDAFFSQDMSPVAIPFSLALLAGGVLVWRRNPAWGMMIFGLAAITIPLSTVPRYYIMVMPMLWLGWIILLSKLTLRVPIAFKGAVMMVGIGLPIALNVGRTVGFIAEQRKVDYLWLAGGGSRQEAFYSYYRDGIVLPMRRVADLINQHTTPQDKIIGPWAHVLAYFSDRRVLGERTIFFEKELRKYPTVLHDTEPDYVVGPTHLYELTDQTMRDMLRRRILIPMRRVATSGEGDQAVYLSAAVVRPPPENVKWTQYKGASQAMATTRISADERAEILRKKQRKLELAKRERKAKREKIERREKLERRERLERAERKAKIERREKLERRRKLEARQRREARERRNAAGTTRPAIPATQPISAADYPLLEKPAWLTTGEERGAVLIVELS